ncbi:hypothetical protein [Alteromonas sp. RKMC-009]|uniref:hypothetical protein n=1 Tax=Alteromonas sp. RKMC-009 TaxID=2267264 RepID=UPI000E6A10DE|nr:hypothetical protein [Alteromonas sp. RKMC-009]AYA64944.1 hypothetical protein DS731_13490 [Alteromonas sp. RKMC-009]
MNHLISKSHIISSILPILVGITIFLPNGKVNASTENIPIDLAVAPEKSTIKRKSGVTEIVLEMKNMLPAADYSSTVKSYYPSIEKLTKPEGLTSAQSKSDSAQTIEGAMATASQNSMRISNDLNQFSEEVKSQKDSVNNSDEILKALYTLYFREIYKQCHLKMLTPLDSLYATEIKDEKNLASAIQSVKVSQHRYLSAKKGTYSDIVEFIKYNFLKNPNMSEPDWQNVTQQLAQQQVENYNWLEVSEDCVQAATMVDNELAKTTSQKNLIFEAGKTLEYTLTRNYLGDIKTWTYIWEQESPVVWLYNISYVYISPESSKKYYTESYGDEDGSYIVRQYDNSGADYLPAGLFTYILQPETYRATGNSWGVSAGLSLDPERPGILGGGSYTLGQNITFTLGLAMTKEQQLNGKYSAYARIQIISAPLMVNG